MTARLNRSRLKAEALEDRLLFAVTQAAVNSDGLLVIAGSPQSEAIVVHEQNNLIKVDGWNGAFNASQVKGIVIAAGAGDDFIANLTTRPSLISAGAGHDFVIGGAASDIVFGEAGDDYVLGMGGNDWIEGGTGNDYLVGGAGVDRLLGQDGVDIFYDVGVSNGIDRQWFETAYASDTTPRQSLLTYLKHMRSMYTPNYNALQGQLASWDRWSSLASNVG